MFALAVITRKPLAARQALKLMASNFKNARTKFGGERSSEGELRSLSSIPADLFARIPPHIVQKVWSMQEQLMDLPRGGEGSKVWTWKGLVDKFTVRRPFTPPIPASRTD